MEQLTRKDSWIIYSKKSKKVSLKVSFIKGMFSKREREHFGAEFGGKSFLLCIQNEALDNI